MKLGLQMALAAMLAAPAMGNPAPLPVVKDGQKRWIVTFKPKVKRDGREKALAQHGLKAAAHIATDGDSSNEFSAAVVDAPLDSDLAAALGVAQGDILSVEEDRNARWIRAAGISFQAAPLPAFGHVMQGFHFPRSGAGRPAAAEAPSESGKLLAARPELTWGVLRVRAPAAWDVTEGAGIRVAVIDSGVDGGHPDLQGKVVGGYNAVKKTEAEGEYGDDNGHGTHVAGTIAAIRDNKGVVGVAPKALIYSVRVLDSQGNGNLSDVIDGLIWSVKNEMQVVNMSLGSSLNSPTMHRAIRFAKGSGVVIVAAAGNSGGAVSYPGAYPEVISVSSLRAASEGNAETISDFSSRGPEVDFIAPGEDVVSTKLGGGLVSFSGTSMAAPHVAGLAALSVSQGWVGTTGPDGVLQQLKRASKPVAGLSLEQQGAGLIDASRLVR